MSQFKTTVPVRVRPIGRGVRPDGGPLVTSEGLKPGLRVVGLVPNAVVEIVQLDWYETDTLEIVYRTPDGAGERM